jgi:hypothetical protein
MQLGYQHTYHGYDIALNPQDDKAWWKLYKKKWRGHCRSHDNQGKQGAEYDSNSKSSGILTAEDFDAVIGHCAAITDFDAACFAQDLIAAYPDAKVILNTRRDREAWYRSCQNTIMALKGDWKMWARSFFCSELFWVEENFLRCLWPAFYRGDFAHTGKWVLDEHCAMVKGCCVGETAREVLEWSPEDGWEPLCKFLGNPVPDGPFPSGNTSEDYNVKVKELYSSFNRRADRNMGIAAGIFAVLVLLFWML